MNKIDELGEKRKWVAKWCEELLVQFGFPLKGQAVHDTLNGLLPVVEAWLLELVHRPRAHDRGVQLAESAVSLALAHSLQLVMETAKMRRLQREVESGKGTGGLQQMRQSEVLVDALLKELLQNSLLKEILG